MAKNRFREMTLEELLNEENELRTAMFNLRLGNTTKELENTDQIRFTRRELARVLTEINQREKAPTA